MTFLRPAVLWMSTWLAVLLVAYRSVFSVVPGSKVLDPVEAFFFDTDTTIPALHFALFALVLIYRRRTIYAALSSGAGPVAGICGGALAGLGIGLLAWARFTGQIDLEIDSLVLVLAGSGLIAGGGRLLDRLVLPLALLWLARPLPPMLTHHLHEWMQRAAGTFAHAVLSPFAATGRSGHLLSFQGRVFEVVEGCSGLRLEITLVTATLVYLAFLSRSRRQTLGVLTFAVLLGPLMNGLRIVSIMLNPTSDVAQVHAAQGLIFVSFSIVVIALLDRLLESRVWPAPTPTPSSSPANHAHPADSTLRAAEPWAPTSRRIGLGAIALACLAASLYAYPRYEQSTGAAWALHEIGMQVGPWKFKREIKLDREFWGSVRFGDRLDWEFERRGKTGLARVFVVSDRRHQRDRSSSSPKTRLRGPEWQITESVPVRLETRPFLAERSIQQSGRERWLTLHYQIGRRSLLEDSLRWMLALDLRPGATPADLVTVRLEVQIDERNPALALARLDELQSLVAERLERAAPRRPGTNDPSHP